MTTLLLHFCATLLTHGEHMNTTLFVCNSSEPIYIEFLTEYGDLPLMTADLTYLYYSNFSIAEYQKGAVHALFLSNLLLLFPILLLHIFWCIELLSLTHSHSRSLTHLSHLLTSPIYTPSSTPYIYPLPFRHQRRCRMLSSWYLWSYFRSMSVSPRICL